MPKARGMSGFSRLERNFAPLRELSPALRKKVLTELSYDASNISAQRLKRLVHVLDRHVFRGEASTKVYEALGISRQQFYIDLREALRRARNVLARERNRSAAAVMENPRRGLLTQAKTFYDAGASRRAEQLLQDLRGVPLSPADSGRLAALQFRTFDDLQAFDRFPETLEYLTAIRERTPVGDCVLVDATLHWLRTCTEYYAGNPAASMHEYGAMLQILRPRAAQGDRDAAVAFCEFAIAGAHFLRDFGVGGMDHVTAEELLREAESMLNERDDLPSSLLPALHASRAILYSGSLSTVHRARTERAVAYRLGVERGAPRELWVVLSMEVSESVARGERAHALDCATALYESVHATDSIEWKPFARSRLALTYNSVGRYDDVARLIPLRDAQRAPYDPHTVLPVCEMLIGRGDYETCLKFATGLAESLEGLFRAAALTHRAHALFEMKHSVQALADITEAVRMYDSLHGQSSYLVVSAYQTAYYITGNVRYRDMVRSLLRALDEEMPSTAVGPQRALTARQYQIASLAAQGATNREIANNLHLSVRTVGNALNAIYARLSIRARWQLAEALRRHGQ